jgi:hypothetical protein
MRMNMVSDLNEELPNDLLCGMAAGLCAGLIFALINQLSFDPAKISRFYQARSIVFGLITYCLSAILVNQFSTRRFRKILPNWLVISIIGGLMFTMMKLGPGIIGGWLDPLNMDESLIGYLTNEIRSAQSLILLLIAVTTPITFVVSYRRKIIAIFIRSRHALTPRPVKKIT